MNTVEQLNEAIDSFRTEYEKFAAKGNKAAGTRARQALLQMGKLVKEVRKEIQEAKTNS